MFKTLDRIISPQIGRMLTTTSPAPIETEISDTTKILHEFENVRLYLFSFVKELADIKEQIMLIKWQLDKIEVFAAQATGNAPPMMFGNRLEPNPIFDKSGIYKGPNKNRGQDFVRKNIAQILKNMIPQHYMEQMPPEVRDAYHNILSVMAPPNDPIWEQEKKKDPREPESEPWSFKQVADYWNSIAEGTKKIDDLGADVIDEAVKGATEMLSEDEDESKEKKESNEKKS